MQKARNRVWSIVLACVMLITMMPASAFAADAGSDPTSQEMPAPVDNVITLTNDVDISETGYEVDGNITLDLNGFTLTAANTAGGCITVPAGSSLTLQDSSEGASGVIQTDTPYQQGSADGGIIRVTGGTFTMEGGNINTVCTTPSNNGQFAVTVGSGGSVVIDSGKIEAGWYAISGNGNDKTESSSITINGGELVSTADYALYLPHNGETTITGGVVTGAAGGVAIRRGTLTVNGGTIASEGTSNTGEWSDGTGGMGNAAINVGDNKLYGDTTVNISGGNFTAAREAVSVKVGEGSSFKADVSITGGTFADDVSVYVPTGYVVTGEGPYTVKACEGIVAEVTPPKDEENTSSAEVGGSFKPNQAAGEDETDEGSVSSDLSSVTIDVTTGEKEEGTKDPVPNSNVTETEVTVDTSSVSSLANEKIDATLYTDVATLGIPAAAWQTINKSADGQNVVLSVEATESDGTVTSWDVTATVVGESETNVFENSDDPITITVNYTIPTGKTGVHVYCTDTGEAMETTYKNNELSWKTTHFSNFVPVAYNADDEATWVVTGSEESSNSGSFSNALGAVKNSGGTITLLKNVELDEITSPLLEMRPSKSLQAKTSPSSVTATPSLPHTLLILKAVLIRTIPF